MNNTHISNDSLTKIITQINSKIDYLRQYYLKITQIFAETSFLINDLGIWFESKGVKEEFWMMMKDFDDWIINGKIITDKMMQSNVIEVMQQKLIEKSIAIQNYEIIQNQAIEEVIQKLEFIAGSGNLELNYVNSPENQKEFQTEYGVIKWNLERQCQNIIGYQRVRGDGNCFYTAFFYQYLQILLQSQNKKQKIQEFISLISQQSLMLFSNEQSILKTTQEVEIKKYFVKVLEELIDHPQNILSYFSKFHKKFYVCAIILFRNLVKEIYQKNQGLISNFLENDLYEEILTWQKECNTNQVIIRLLCQELKLQVNLYFFTKNSVDIQIYNENNNLSKINLLFRPGHYQIAICKDYY